MSFISGLRRVSLAEYLLVLRIYSPLLHMTCSITATVSIVSTLRGMKTSMGMIIYVILSYCLCWIWLWNWLVFELSVCEGLQQLCFRYLWTRVVITMWTLMYSRYLWNGCNMWLVMLNHVWSWLYVSWLEILHGFIELPDLYGFKYDGLITTVIAFVLMHL